MIQVQQHNQSVWSRRRLLGQVNAGATWASGVLHLASLGFTWLHLLSMASLCYPSPCIYPLTYYPCTLLVVSVVAPRLSSPCLAIAPSVPLQVSVSQTPSLRAIVLELYGTGNLSARKSSLIDALSAAIERGIIIVAASQCLRGTVNLSAYALGKKLEAIGVVQVRRFSFCSDLASRVARVMSDGPSESILLIVVLRFVEGRCDSTTSRLRPLLSSLGISVLPFPYPLPPFPHSVIPSSPRSLIPSFPHHRLPSPRRCRLAI